MFQILVPLAGRTLSCRKHPMSKPFIVPDIVPGRTRYRIVYLKAHDSRHEPSISKVGILYWIKNLQYRPRYSNLTVFATQYRAQYRRCLFDIEAKTFDINVFYCPCHHCPWWQWWRYWRFFFDIGSYIEFLSGNIVHISILGTIIESVLLDMECFINQYLPYIDVEYYLTLDMMLCLPAERFGQVPELEFEAGGPPVDSSSSHKVMTRWKHMRNN